MGQDKEDPVWQIKLNFDFPSFRDSFPKEWLRYITPSEVRKAGFEKTASEETGSTKTFRKSFSDVVSLEITTSRKKGEKRYCWSMNEENFKTMLSELEAIKEYLDKEAKGIALLARSSRSSILDDSYDDYRQSEYMQKITKATNTVAQMKKDFRNKYNEFMTFNSDVQIQTPVFRYQFFFFDACKNTHQLNLYFEFIRLILDVFGAIRKSKPSVRKISPEKIKEAIAAYYALLFSIKKIRAIYMQGVSFKKLQEQFPMFNEKKLEDITLEADDKKGWEYKASGFALNFASYITETTTGNFKQILKKEKKFASHIKKRLSKIKNLEETLAGTPLALKGSLPELNVEIVPEDDWVGLYRWSISHFGTLDES